MIFRCDTEGNRDQIKEQYKEVLQQLNLQYFIGECFKFHCVLTDSRSNVQQRFTAYVFEGFRKQCTGSEVRILLEECGFRNWKENSTDGVSKDIKVKIDITNETIIKETGSIKLARTADRNWSLIIIIDGGKEKMLLNDFGRSSYAWQPIFERGHLKGTPILMKNVYLSKATCWYFLQWLLQAGAVIVAPNCAIGEKVISMIVDEINEKASFGEGKCCFAQVMVGGLSGYGQSDKVNTWLKERKPNVQHMKYYKDLME